MAGIQTHFNFLRQLVVVARAAAPIKLFLLLFAVHNHGRRGVRCEHIGRRMAPRGRRTYSINLQQNRAAATFTEHQSEHDQQDQ